MNLELSPEFCDQEWQDEDGGFHDCCLDKGHEGPHECSWCMEEHPHET